MEDDQDDDIGEWVDAVVTHEVPLELLRELRTAGFLLPDPRDGEGWRSGEAGGGWLGLLRGGGASE
jgi:hypothetical protein